MAKSWHNGILKNRSSVTIKLTKFRFESVSHQKKTSYEKLLRSRFYCICTGHENESDN